MIFVWIYIGIAVLWLRPIYRYLLTGDGLLTWPVNDIADFLMLFVITAYTASFWGLILPSIVIRKAILNASGGDINALALKLAGKKAKKLSYAQLLQRNERLEKELRVGHEN